MARDFLLDTQRNVNVLSSKNEIWTNLLLPYVKNKVSLLLLLDI